MDDTTSLSDLRADATKALRAYEKSHLPPDLRRAAEALVKMRAHFTTNDGLPDWRGRTWAYRSTVSEILADLNLSPDRRSNLLAALRYHVGNVVREVLTEEERRDAGLMVAGPRERTAESRQQRAAEFRALVPTRGGALSPDDVISTTVTVETLLHRVGNAITGLDRAHLRALGNNLKAVDRQLGYLRTRIAQAEEALR